MHRTAFVMFSAATLMASGAHAQSAEQDEPRARTKDDCASFRGTARSACLDEIKRSAQSRGGPSAKDAKLINEANAAAQAKQAAGDFAGAVAVYETALGQAGKDTPKQFLLVGKAAAQRRQAIAAYNAAGRPEYPPPGSTNEVIRAANAANAALQARKTAAAVPLLQTALATAAEAATVADGNKEKGADEAIGIELREDASLLYQLDRANVLATPRPSAQLEATWLKRWLADAALGQSLVAKFGVPVAAALATADASAGLTLADEVKARSGNDPDGVIGYAEIVAAKAPAGDPRRAAALAGLAAIEATVVDQQKARLTAAKTALAVR